MDYINGSSSRTKLNKDDISSSTLPSNMRHNHLQHRTGYSDTVHHKDARSKDSMLTTSQEMLSPSSEPPPILPRRSASSLSSPNKPAVPPKPKNISNKTPSPKKSSPELN